MEKELKAIFEGDYFGQDFIFENVVKKVFGDVVDLRAADLHELSKNETDEIKTFRSIAKIDGVFPIWFFDIELTSKVQLKRSRVKIQNCVKRFLGQDDVSALMFFHFADDEKKEWRVSYAHFAFNKKDNTSARRYTYFCGKGNSSRTIAERFSKLQEKTECGESITESDLLSAFSVEAVSDDFFREYKAFYEDLVQYITGNRFIEVKKNVYENKKIHEMNKEIFPQFLAKSSRPLDTSATLSAGYARGDRADARGDRADDDDASQKAVRDYVKKLMGRVVFLCFLQKKGYLNGDKNFLKNLFASSTQTQKNNFLESVLEPLFFGVLNTKKGERKALFALENYDAALLEKFCNIPYLNGGLFEKDENDKLTVLLPSYFWCNEGYEDAERKFFANGVSSISTGSMPSSVYPYSQSWGLFDFFSRYNFTIDETDPIDKEVGVDPEMLGKIFENLLEDNKDKDAFYTPKEIVQYMARESVKAFLQNAFSGQWLVDSEQSESSQDSMDCHDCERSSNDGGLQDSGDCHDCERSSNEGGLQSGDAIYALVYENDATAFDEDEKAKMLEKIKGIKICDPAVGSGAFPMGVLNELFAIRIALGDETPHNQIKKEIVKNNIYGVDLDKGAVDIARLRFWLAIIVDEDENTEPPPLPNLDYKIMRGNSLIESYKGIDLSDLLEEEKNGLTDWKTERQRIKELQEAMKGYFEPHDDIAKNKIRKQMQTEIIALMKEKVAIDTNKQKIVAELEKMDLHDTSEFFLWHTWFSDVFAASHHCEPSLDGVAIHNGGGFDVVLGNPPYVQLQKNGGALASLYEKQGYKTFARTGDIYCLFYERAMQLLKSGGINCFITSNKWMRAGYGEALRAFLSKQNPLQLVDFGGVKVFESATVDTNILITQKEANEGRTACYKASSDSCGNKAVTTSSAFVRANEAILMDFSKNSGDSWVILSAIEKSIKEKIEKAGTPLKDWDIQINYGIKTGFNDAFIIDEDTRQGILDDCKTEGEKKRTDSLIRPILRGKDIKRYGYKWAGLYIINTHNGVKEKNIPPVNVAKDYPAIKAHLDKYWDKISKRDDKGVTPYNLRNCAYMSDFEKPKVVYTPVNAEYRFAIVPPGIYLNNALFMIIGENIKTICAIANSKAFVFYLRLLLSNEYTYGAGNLFENFPTPRLDDTKEIDALVDKIVDCHADKSARNDVEKQIDAIVYKLYGLTAEEVAIIEQ